MVTLKVARAVLWHFGDTNLGTDPGHFVSRLLGTVSAADDENLALLRGAYPDLIGAWEKVAREPWGLDWLRGVVKDFLDGSELALDFFMQDEA